MLSLIKSYALYGLNGIPVDVEADINLCSDENSFSIVGLPDISVKESKDRVRSAIRNSGAKIPKGTITINLAPADIKKEGASLDLAIACAIIRISDKMCTRNLGDLFMLGELSLEGRIRRISGVLPMVLSAKEKGFKRVILPYDDAKEAALVDGIEVYGVETLKEVIAYMHGEEMDAFPHTSFNPQNCRNSFSVDLKYVKGQFAAKRALEVAVSGGHNMLMTGAPGAGKTMLAKCIPTIMPDMVFKEALETTAIHSVYGDLSFEGVIASRPFITPHHTASSVSLIGGGTSLRPGLISLAHNGVLYLDEMPEYPRSTLECLRQPLEDGIVTVSRARGNVRYPAEFMLVASMNPCPCGNLGSDNPAKKCTCTDTQIRKYRSRISGPLLDRIDIQVQVDGVNYDDLSSNEELESSEKVRSRVNKARMIQAERFKDDDILLNARMKESHLAKYCTLDSKCEEILKNSFKILGLSARAKSRILKVARTIADLDYSENIQKKHLLEAIGYRSLDNNEI